MAILRIIITMLIPWFLSLSTAEEKAQINPNHLDPVELDTLNSPDDGYQLLIIPKANPLVFKRNNKRSDGSFLSDHGIQVPEDFPEDFPEADSDLEGEEVDEAMVRDASDDERRLHDEYLEPEPEVKFTWPITGPAEFLSRFCDNKCRNGTRSHKGIDIRTYDFDKFPKTKIVIEPFTKKEKKKNEKLIAEGKEPLPIKYKTVKIDPHEGDPIFAAADGVVTRVGVVGTGFGYGVVIKHSDRLKSVYAHMKQPHVLPFQLVHQGEFIGFMGHTGRVIRGKGKKGTHLHFEIRLDNKAVNPVDYLPKLTEGFGIFYPKAK